MFNQGHALIIGVGDNRYEVRLRAPITAVDAQAVADVLRDQRYAG